LDSGANDYVTKPFEIEELLARIRAQLKQRSLSNNSDFQEMKYRHLKILPMAREVYIDDELIYLTQREYDLLHFLVEHK
ncbi:DNA-binding response regulator, partial [Planococcus sp. SIMBA_143]